MLALSDVSWTEYERDGDKDIPATKHALIFRAVFMPSLAAALFRVCGVLKAFADRLQDRLKARIARQPFATNSLVPTLFCQSRTETCLGPRLRKLETFL